MTEGRRGPGADPDEAEVDAEVDAFDIEAAAEAVATAKRKRKKGPTAAQTMGGIIFGFEQQVWRTAPPPQELVEHARPDKPVAAPDGSRFTILMPDDLSLADDVSCGPDSDCLPGSLLGDLSAHVSDSVPDDNVPASGNKEPHR